MSKQLIGDDPIEFLKQIEERADGHAPGFDIAIYARPTQWLALTRHMRAEIARLNAFLSETAQKLIAAEADRDRIQEAKRRALAVADERSKENVVLRAALVPFGKYAKMRDAKPLVGLDDAIHRIHLGSEWEAEITLTDCRRAREALGEPAESEHEKWLQRGGVSFEEEIGMAEPPSTSEPAGAPSEEDVARVIEQNAPVSYLGGCNKAARAVMALLRREPKE